MKKFSLILSLMMLVLQLPSRAELIFGPTTASNRFVLGDGQAALISAVLVRGFESGVLPQPIVQMVSGGEINELYLRSTREGTALGGPLELILPEGLGISYKVITNSAIRSFFCNVGATNTLDVPAGKTMKFFGDSSMGGFPSGFADLVEIVRKGVSYGNFQPIHSGAELDGPLTLHFLSRPGNYTFPYYFIDQATVLPDQLAVQAPTGSSEIQIQKSVDLTNWFPSIIVPLSNDQKAFYRLRIAQ